MSAPTFFLNEITDKYIRENFKRLASWFLADPVIRTSFSFYQIAVPDSTTQTFSHGLTYQPKDVILLSISGGQSVIFNFDKFTSTSISYTASGACTIRFFLGTYA